MKKNREKDINRLTLLSVYDEHLKRLESRIGKDRSASTWKAMQQGRKHVEMFLTEQFHTDDILLQQLTPQFIYDFSVWLSAERGLRSGTVWLACQHLKGVVKRACQQGKLTWNPFDGFHIAKNIRPREYLSEEEMTRLMKHKFKKQQLSFTRDVFVFAAFTGLSFIDIKELRHSDIVEINGRQWIFSKRHKTQVAYQVRLLDIPLEILHRYDHQGEHIFEDMEYRTMAKRIHRVMDEVGIHKRISFHCARHTFAVLALNNGMPIESLSRMLGHTNITTTQIYAKITLQKLDSDMNKLSERLRFLELQGL